MRYALSEISIRKLYGNSRQIFRMDSGLQPWIPRDNGAAGFGPCAQRTSGTQAPSSCVSFRFTPSGAVERIRQFFSLKPSLPGLMISIRPG